MNESSDGIEVTLTFGQLVELVTAAMNIAPTRGDYTEVGLVYEYLYDRHLV